ncbi:MAG: branched-chain amino acid ABC transporter permease [Armatimonadota bacterium]|nr:branched-chain amino acid ABC transporter permease [Armatimonadota bacterium]MDR7559651.1 branched-chain amino acid ABC transporter permease [Armatimonadota bacterium]MDR7577118.1 branched-chain amino acid ABC transporter permease [Armatimonadota bacterium]MDR7587227.1 branched-chain amino acid ABC transporter permease [Armatimonadota bacterium]MDR7611194.1 branched-chain amino acid ABC transporter permease [Armatimonadota bacterium]
MEIWLQNVTFGALIGGLYGLAAVGLALVFGVLRMLNVSHGELLMLGGYGTVWLFTLWGVDPFASVLLVGPALFAAGAVLYRALFARLARLAEESRIQMSILIGFGLALALHAAAILAWTADERAVTAGYAGMVLRLGPLVAPVTRLAGLGVACVALAALHLILQRTDLGRAIRATAEDWEAASLMGVPVGRVYRTAFALGCALAGVAGALVAVSDAVSPAIGLSWTLKALIVVVLAGLGNIFGTFIAGVLLGVAESAAAFALGGVFREVVGLAVFVAVLLVRPEGLFGRGA